MEAACQLSPTDGQEAAAVLVGLYWSELGPVGVTAAIWDAR